ncbi:autotransporter assembly complex protein TamA [Azotobacter chroococcum]|uniref:Translocation and assembly module subunit TamA n=1 Tax=Azotobacter chroococcum TaxID=353 RepID=A0AAQ0BXE5_9GAMM|nr:autotransporter assembly complex family protein [Azotobacter chroococcum]QQE87059.1 outer membrane protein assembly factor [Azotobacter chroococcum]
MRVFIYTGTFLGLLLCASAVFAQARLEVQVEPASASLRTNIEGYVGELGERDEQALRRLAPAAEAQARSAAEALGYYHTQISSEVRPGDPPTLILHVIPGEPVRLRRVDIRIEGPAAQFEAFRVPQSRGLRPGAQLNHGRYESAKKLIQNQASRFGFFAGRFTRQRLFVDPAAGVADIELVYVSGPRYRLGEVVFEGETPFEDAFMRRMVPFEAGAPYDSELIARLQQNLQARGYFEGVRVDASPEGVNGQVVPVLVQLQMRKPRSFGIGAGFSTDVGPRGRLNWTRHWGNSQGHSYGAEMELSQPKQNVGFWYDIPLDPPMTDKLRFVGGYQFEELADTDTRSRLLKVGPEWHRRLDNGWQQVFSLKWQREEYRYGSDNGLSTLLLPGVAYSYLNSDHPLDPSRGYRLQVEMAAASEGLLSDANLLYSSAMLKGLTTLAGRHRLLGRLQFGGNFTDEYATVPPSLRFFAGGDQSVRGYEYQTLSPTNSDGDHIGGRYMIAGSLEYQYALRDKWRIATFIDQGNAFNSKTSPDLKTGMGFGVRWVSPVGPLRVDVAHGLDDGSFRLHFSMGPEL